jgi:hypothetical protein
MQEISVFISGDKNLGKSLNNGLKCRKPVFMRVSGICFIKWLWFGSICGRDKGCKSTDEEIKE